MAKLLDEKAWLKKMKPKLRQYAEDVYFQIVGDMTSHPSEVDFDRIEEEASNMSDFALFDPIRFPLHLGEPDGTEELDNWLGNARHSRDFERRSDKLSEAFYTALEQVWNEDIADID